MIEIFGWICIVFIVFLLATELYHQWTNDDDDYYGQ
jgi:hypothetical protein